MSFNDAKLKTTFIESLGLVDSEYNIDLKIGDNVKWDSVGHLSLIFAIESDFDVKFDIEKIPELTSVAEIVAEIKKLKS